MAYGPDITGGKTYDQSNYHPGYDGSLAFDDDLNTGWGVIPPSFPEWVEVDLGSGNEANVRKLRLNGGSDFDYCPTEFKLKASNTGAFSGEEVTVLNKTGVTGWTNNVWKEWIFSNGTNYRYYRFYHEAGGGGGFSAMSEIEMMEAVGEITTSSSTTTSTSSSTSSTASTISTISTTSTTSSSSSTTTTAPPQTCFCVFKDVAIPPGSVITKANIFFKSYDTKAGIDVDADIHLVDEDDAQPPSDKYDLDTRAVTNYVPWDNIDKWYDNVSYKTPNLKDLLQVVIDRSGWTINNNVMAVLKSWFPPTDIYRLWSAEEFLGGTEKACLRASWKEPTQCQTPVFDPAVEFQLATFDCTLRTYPTDASIYYTTDGSTPDENSTLYTGPFEISSDTTVKAIAYKEYWEDSEIASKDYDFFTYSLPTIGVHQWILDSTYNIDTGQIQQYENAKVYVGTRTWTPTQVSLFIWDTPSQTGSLHTAITHANLQTVIDYKIDSGGTHHIYWMLGAYLGPYTFKYTYGSPTTGWTTVADMETSTVYIDNGVVLIDNSGYPHMFTQFHDGVIWQLHHHEWNGSAWRSEIIDDYPYSQPVSGVTTTAGTFVLTQVGGSNVIRIYEGSFGSWSITNLAGIVTSPWFQPSRTVYNAGAGRDDTTFIWINSTTNELRQISNITGSWEDSFVADTSVLYAGPLWYNTGSASMGWVVDSNGYWHIVAYTRPENSNGIPVYGTNKSGAWVWYDISNPLIALSIQHQLSFHALSINEARQELYFTYRVAPWQTYQGLWVGTIDIS